MTSDNAAPEPDVRVQTWFVRQRNALLAEASMEGLLISYYLHRADVGLDYGEREDTHLKAALGALTLHLASRPRQEVVAWTVHFPSPPLNVFVTGDNPLGRIVGQVFTENVREGSEGMFYADVARGADPTRRSVVDFDGEDFFLAAERFSRMSDQREVRYFALGEDRLAMVAAQPGCDLEWLAALDADAVGNLKDTEALGALEERGYNWSCGCSQERILGVLAPSMRASPEALFEDEDVVRVHCPRCGMRYAISREMLEAYIQQNDA